MISDGVWKNMPLTSGVRVQKILGTEAVEHISREGWGNNDITAS